MASLTVSALQRLPSAFPPVRFAAAYGSTILTPSPKQRMIDLLFAVDDPLAWHAENIKLHPSHYSALKYLGPQAIHTVQERWGGKVYYNTLVEWEGRLIKYGIISTSSLLQDMTEWTSLYTSGRFHKPVMVIQEGEQVHEANQINLQHALHCSLLLLPEHFTESDLFCTLSSLSYMGDFRMHVGEDPHKVKKIVTGNEERFRELYCNVLSSVDKYIQRSATTNTFSQDTSPHIQEEILSKLPEELRSNLTHTTAEMPMSERMRRGVQQIVGPAALSQSAKGIITAGPMKTLQYINQKVNR